MNQQIKEIRICCKQYFLKFDIETRRANSLYKYSSAMRPDGQSNTKCSNMNGLKIVFSLLACVLLVSANKIDVDSDSDDYIVNGRVATRNQFPWIVSLRTTQNVHRCGAFILSDRWVGSAAHCTQKQWSQPSSLLAAVGAHSRTDGHRHRLTRIINHPRFSRVTRTFDVCILQTVDRIAITPNGPVRTIRFPTGPVIHDGQTVLMAGWGQTEVGYHTCTRL